MREAGVETQKVKKKKMSDSTCKQRIVLDMSYYDMMKYKVIITYIFLIIILLILQCCNNQQLNIKSIDISIIIFYQDLCKCSNQVLRCYGLNRRMENPMQLYFCSYEGKIKETMDKHNGSQLWDVCMCNH